MALDSVKTGLAVGRVTDVRPGKLVSSPQNFPCRQELFTVKENAPNQVS